ncbi:tRNA (adenosine(37)-N6)-threonylcarbamoyltransferase complex ATPase subunit type 1 TsaE [Ructibacterium gallinarum]|uniref:tRNA threonylcarbamoyladenosine biosynthesis protein TsaE n=1 Tax=Ructibacterium gallinarum TaxID=2779355 RepID=A0A9D5LWS0_9FIRM|nr:tRNA (adenosine(37)-N6)-threonylcarbamoyltransferase complex ATPase subunit type 1 TsaE [Ructibacterium gallinarum]MBE5039168.1 tRNA (adenosine(37)-N6)-threonylcarbamoyltransferase complex ATPase subunit type 1 TsaE [Ructibacterium gallinarum]
MLRIETNSPEETRKAGKDFSKTLSPGAILALSGDLGCGKTEFVKGAADCFGGGDMVTSPTFALVNEYPGTVPVYHFDVYRLENPDPALCDWMDDYLFGDGICLIEWADNVRAVLPENTIWIYFKKDPARGENFREIIIC